jgi:uncharacterized protein
VIIDSHYHLDERLLPIESLIKKMDESGVDKTALIAELNDPLPDAAPLLMDITQYIMSHAATRGLGKILMGRFSADGSSIKLPVGTFRIYADPDNAPVYAAMKKYPKRFLAWTFVNPRGSRDPLKEIDAWKKSPGFIGVKAHPFWHRYPPAELMPVAERAAKLKKPLLLHLGYDDHGDFMPLVNEVPGLILILAHTAFPGYSDTWKIIRARKNIFVDVSQTTYVGAKTTRAAVEYLGAERCLFGTDGPYGSNGKDGLYDYGLIKKRIEKLFPDGKTRRLLLGENFARIAGL